MPNNPVDMDSWGSSACYPRRTFYPLSDGPSTRDHRITMTDFRLCSTCQSRSQASLCHCTRRPISDRSELTMARLRYSFGGDRPSQTTHHTLSRIRITDRGSTSTKIRVVFQGWLHRNWRPCFKAYHLSYPCLGECQCKAIVKVHGVFPSSRGYTASSQRFQFH